MASDNEGKLHCVGGSTGRPERCVFCIGRAQLISVDRRVYHSAEALRRSSTTASMHCLCAGAAAEDRRRQTQLLEALPLVLRNTDLRRSSNHVCAMLCASKELWQVIHQECRGQLAVEVQKNPEQYTCWISKHGCLLQQLELGWLDSYGTAVADALRAAAGLPGGLPLESLTSSELNSQVLGALQAGHSSSLTSLCILSNTRHAAREWEECVAAIAGLTSLKSLSLGHSKTATSEKQGLHVLLPSLAGLVQTTNFVSPRPAT